MHRQPRRYARRPVEPIVIQTGEDAPSLTITMLGAGQEVGRSCCVIEHRGKKIVCDAGLHPSYPGLGALPFIDELDWSTVDAILVTQYVDDIVSQLKVVFITTMPPGYRISPRR